MKKFASLTVGLLASLVTAQAQFFTNGNLAVVRISGYDTTSSAGDAVFIDQYTTSGTLAGSIALPTSGANAMALTGLTYAGLMTVTPDGKDLVIPAYNIPLANVPPSSNLNFIVSGVAPRAIGILDAYGSFSVPIKNTTVFNGYTICGGASDGTNYWMTGNGPSGEFYTGLYPQTVYMGTASSPTAVQVATNISGSGVRAVNVYNSGGAYGLYMCGYASNTAFSTTVHGSGGFLLSNISGVLPTSATGSTNLFPDGTSSETGSDLTVNPAGTIAYTADSSLGIIQFTNSGSGWVSNHTIVPTNAGFIVGKAAYSVTADWSQNPPVVYATTSETATNRLVSFSDTGYAGYTQTATTPVINNLAFGTLVSGVSTNTLRGVRFAPSVLYGYVSVQPLPVIGNPGQTATFTAGVLGSPAPSVQWYSNSVANPTYVAISGATSTNLSLSGITVAQSGSLFYVVVSNVYGVSTSSPVSLTVNNPSISAEPVGTTNFPGTGPYSLCVSAAGTGTLTYQWFSNGIPIVGANSACYTVANSVVSNAAIYTVNVTNTAGANITTATSTPTVISYSPYLLYDTFTYPNGVLFGDSGSPWTEESGSNPIYETNGRVQIDQSIGALGTSFGQSLFFQPVAENSTVMWASFTVNLKTLPTSTSGSYLAYFQDTNFGFYGRVVALTSNSPALTPDIPAVAYPGTYRIGIANKATSASAVVELDMAPGIDYQVVAYYDMVNQFCQVAVNPSQAEYNAVYSPFTDVASPLVSAVTSDSFTPGTLPIAAYGLRQATGCGVVQLDNLEVADDWNGAGSGYTAVTANSTLAKPVVGFITPGITNYSGNSNILEVAASGIDVTYQWYQGTNQLTDTGSFTGSATPVLTINPESTANSGNYTCVVSNSAGATTSPIAPVSINGNPTPPTFTLQPVSQTNSLGGNVTFTATAVGTGPITYSWNTDGSPNGATGSSFTLTRVTTNLTGSYYSVTASGGASPSATSSNAYLTVLGPVVTNIAFLRSLQITNAAPTITVAASNSTTVYQVTGVVIESTNIESATYAEYWIQDSTAGIEFFVIDPTFRPALGDVVTVTGVVDIYDDALELDGSANNPSEPYTITSTNGEGKPLPYPSELIPFGFATANPGLSSLVYQGSLATFTNCYFTTPGGTFAGNGTVVVTNNSGLSYSLYIAQSAGPDLNGTTIPAFAYSITGVYDQFTTTYELNLSAGSDIVTTPPPPVTDLKASNSGTNVSLKWTAVPASYTYSVWSTTNLSVPFAPLAPGLWFNSTNGSYTATISTNSPTMFFKIVSP